MGQTDSAEQLQQAQNTLKTKDILIERLSKHLESALARLNETTSPVSNSSVVALNAARTELEQQNNLLRVKQEELQAEVDELSKKSQLLDLENRQLFEALNGRPSMDKDSVMHVAKHDNTEGSTPVASEK